MSKAQIPSPDQIAAARAELVERFGLDTDAAGEFVIALLEDPARKGTLAASDTAWVSAYRQYRAEVRPSTGLPGFSVRLHPRHWRTIILTLDTGTVAVERYVARKVKAGKWLPSEAAMHLGEIATARRTLVEAFTAAVHATPGWRTWATGIIPEDEPSATEAPVS